MIRAENLSWSYGSAPVVQAATLATRPGRVLGLIGPNGSGKTTLLRLLHGALRSPTGHVEIDGSPLDRLKPRDLARCLAVVVQEAGGENTMTVAETVMLGRTPQRTCRVPDRRSGPRRGRDRPVGGDAGAGAAARGAVAEPAEFPAR